MRAILCFSLIVATLTAQQAPPPASAPFRVEETTIAQIHEAMKAGRVTCRALVDAYLRRIDAYDKNGPALNALVIKLASAYEQATRHRHAPAATPPLR